MSCFFDCKYDSVKIRYIFCRCKINDIRICGFGVFAVYTFAEYTFSKQKKLKNIYKKRRFIKEFEDLFIKIELQKSLYSNAYYINYYIYCKEIHTYNEVVELSFGDLFGRFCPIVNDKKVSIFDLDILDDNTLIDALYESTKEILNVLENDGIRWYKRIFKIFATINSYRNKILQ